MRYVWLLIVTTLLSQVAYSQFLMDMVDTSSFKRKGVLNLEKNYNYLQISGYMHPQFQVASSKGAPSYNGGDFTRYSDNRFTFRRARVRFDFLKTNENNQPILHTVFQLDGTERGVNIRDFWGRIFENKFQMFSFTTGMFARPFGYEVNRSSQQREVAERGRMSQILMKTERDLGAMVTFNPRQPDHVLHNFQLDFGLFNGQGMAGPQEFDSYKDFIARITYKDIMLAKDLSLSVGVSTLQGGMVQNNPVSYISQKDGSFRMESSADHIGRESPRIYYGGDAQLRLKHAWGATELRAEYWKGTQTSTFDATETPGTLTIDPYYVRDFDGAFFYLLQNIGTERHQVGVRYDWYDPNTNVKGPELTEGGHYSPADIRFDTWCFGYNYYINENLKLMLWYDMVRNEKTALTDYTNDLKDNVFTFRIQYSF